MPGRCDKALPAADFAALEAFDLLRVLRAALAALPPPTMEIEVFLGHASEGLAAVLRTERRRFYGRVPRRASNANMSHRRGTNRCAEAVSERLAAGRPADRKSWGEQATWSMRRRSWSGL